MIQPFLREFRSFYICYGIVTAIFALLFFLYRLPTEFLIQTLLTAATVCILFSMILYWRFVNRMKALQEYLHEETLYLLNKPTDKAYLTLIEKEKQSTRKQLLEYKEREEKLLAIIQLWSHQMKTPIAALSLMSQTDHLVPADVHYQLERLDHYMGHLLNYLKLMNHNSDFRFETVAVREVVVNLIKNYRYQCLQKEIMVDIEGDIQLKTDAKWFSFALSQLLDNAVKYTNKGGRIYIKLSKEHVIIQDTGIGILAEDIPRLFEEGFTGYNGREHQKATGFGLYLTKKVLNALSFDIQISSEINKGTSVCILPNK